MAVYADGRFYSETAIVTVSGSKAVEILSIAVRYLLEMGQQAHISELLEPAEMPLAA
jgi:hypothetical protein